MTSSIFFGGTTMEEIMNMKVDEILLLNELVGVAREAKEAAKLISEIYSKAFGINEEKIEVWHDSDNYNYEYLTHNGFWQARYLHQTYDVECTADGIFEYFKAEYLVNNNYVARCKNGCYLTEEGEKAEIAEYFRAFVSRTKELVFKNVQ